MERLTKVGGSVFLILWATSVGAQGGNFDIASTYQVSEEVQAGDIISFDPETQAFLRSRIVSDPQLFGVVVEDPLLLLETTAGDTPIVRGGEVLVNVSDTNGPISAGDFVTSSNITGIGQRAEAGDTHVIGVATQDFTEGGQTVTTGTGETVSVGQIPVLLSVGTFAKAQSQLNEDTPVQGGTGFSEATFLNVIQYAIAAVIAIGAIYISFRNFGPGIREGIVSIGRNPLAKNTIQSMVAFNIGLIVVISAAGLFLALAILLLPI